MKKQFFTIVGYGTFVSLSKFKKAFPCVFEPTFADASESLMNFRKLKAIEKENKVRFQIDENDKQTHLFVSQANGILLNANSRELMPINIVELLKDGDINNLHTFMSNFFPLERKFVKILGYSYYAIEIPFEYFHHV